MKITLYTTMDYITSFVTLLALFTFNMFNKTVAVSENVQIKLIDDKQAPLYAMLSMADFNQNAKNYIDSVITTTLGDKIKQNIRDHLENIVCNSTGIQEELVTSTNNDSDWVPVFVACPGNKRDVYRSWVTPSPMNDPLKLTQESCAKDHQRRSIIDHWNWKEDLIDQVKVELYKGRHVDAMFLFDGKGSTSISWFSKERLLQSTYTDLSRTATTNYFSIKGYYEADRHFHINRYYGGCPNDAGWLMVVDTRHRSPNACAFDKLYGLEYPYLMYATRNQAGRYDNEGDFGFADLMAVSVKLV